MARKTSPLVWILVALGGLILLCVLGAFAIGAFFVHKAHQAGLDTDLIRRNPAAAVARMAAMANRDVEIVGEDDRGGTITLRDRHTGKTVTMSFDQVKSGFRISADGDDGKTAVMEFGGGPGKLPRWIPSYPGSDAKGTLSVRGSGNDGDGQGGNYTFTTPDDPSKVIAFYEEKVKDLHMTVKLNANGSDGGTMIATEDPERRMLTVLVGRNGGETTVNVTYAEKH